MHSLIMDKVNGVLLGAGKQYGFDALAQKPLGPIIRASELPVWESGSAFLQTAKAVLEEAQRVIPEMAAAERAKAYEEGREAGAKEVIDLLAQMKARAGEHYQSLNREVTELVIKMITDIVGEMPPGAVVASTVLKTLKTLDVGSEFSLYVAADIYEEVGRSLSSRLDPATHSKLILRQDPKLPPYGCRLVSEFGMVDLSIEKQIGILAESLRAAGVGLQR